MAFYSMSATREQLSALRQSLAKIEAEHVVARVEKGPRTPLSEGARGHGRVRLDAGGPLDTASGGGLLRHALHEIVAERQADAAAARGLAAIMAQRATFDGAMSRTIVWTEQDQVLHEIGALSADGLNALGLDPSAVLHVKARDALTALNAAVEAAKCPAVGAVICEIWGTPKALDLNATRRLMLAAQRANATVVLARLGVTPQPSAAETRWSVSALPSAAWAANAPGRSAFSLALLRHRHGVPAGPWPVEWNADDRLLHVQDLRHGTARPGDAPVPGDRAVAFGDGPAASHAAKPRLRLAG